MRFVLFVEGKTERKALPAFLKRWLDLRLSRRVGIKTVKFEGWPEYYADIRKKVALNLSGRVGADVIGCIGLLDLYGPDFYPGGVDNAGDRYRWATKHIEVMVDEPRFSQHFAVHETEAWLLADETILPPNVASALPGRCARPEEVDFDDPPAKLLKRLYREKLRRGYKKVIDGSALFRKLDPDRARGCCPYLAKLLDNMLATARKALSS